MTEEFYRRLGIHASGAMRAALSPAEKRLEQQLAEMESRVRADVAPFADMSPAGQKRRYADMEAPDAFARAYAPHYCTAPPDPFHHDIDALVAGWTPDYHPDGEAFVHVIHGPREHAKSVRARVGLLRRILRGDVHYPLVISEHLYIAQAHVDYLLIELTANARVAADYDVDVILRDRSDGILRLAVTPRATRKRHLVQIDAASYGRPVKGRVFVQHRPDFALIDDFESTRSAKNDQISKEKRDWVLQEVYPALVGPVVWFGNVGHDTSALYLSICHAEGGEEEGRRLMRRGTRPGSVALAAGYLDERQIGLPSPDPAEAPQSPSEAARVPGSPSGIPDPDLPARTAANRSEGDEDDEDGDLFAGGVEYADDEVEAAIAAYVYKAERLVVTPEGRLETEYLWSSRYTWKWYARKKRTMGPFKYSGEFGGDPSREGDFFKREWLEDALYSPDELEAAATGPGWAAFSWFDPAFGKSGKGCDKAVVAVGQSGVDVFVLDAYVRSDEAVVKALHAWRGMFERWGRLGLLHGQYENDFGQDDRLQPDIADYEDTYGPLNVSGDSNKRGSKEARIESLQPLVSRARLRFPRKRSSDMERLFNQVLAYPGGNDDGPDALESAIARLRRGAAGSLEYSSLSRRRSGRTPRAARRRR
jgi:hypothetical protein